MHSRALLGAGLLLAVLTTGCSTDSSGPSGTPDPSDPTTAGTTGSPGPTSSPPTGTTPASPTPTPATGPTITVTDFDLPVLRLHLPDDVDWRLRSRGESASSELLASGFVDVDGSTITTDPGRGLGFYARITADNTSTLDPPLQRLADRTVDGVDGFVLEGKDRDDFIYVYGAVYGEAQVSIRFRFPAESARFRGWIESTLASAEWL